MTVADANVGADTINFNIPTSDSGYNTASFPNAFRIAFSVSTTFALTDSVTIDGTTQTAFSGNTRDGVEVILDWNVNDGGFQINTSSISITFKGIGFYNNLASVRAITGNVGGITVVIDGCEFYRNYGGSIRVNNSTGSTYTITNNTFTEVGYRPVTLVPNGAGRPITAQAGALNGEISSNIFRDSAVDAIGFSGTTVAGNYTTIKNNQFINNGKGFSTIIVSFNANDSANAQASYLFEDNTITGSTDDIAVDLVASTSKATLRRNLIYNNSRYIGIDLGNNGVTANDPGDIDTGANDLMNFPVINSAQDIGAGKFRIKGTMDYKPSEGPITIEIFKSNNEGLGYGGSTAYLGSVTPNADGIWDTEVSVPGDTWSQKMWFTTTATNVLGDTSEFSQNYGVGGSEPQPVYSTCQEKGPTSPPLLYKATSQSSSSILLSFYPPQGDYTNYMLEYGTESNKYFFGNSNIGSKPLSTYLVKNLSPGTKYYFRVGARNGCAAGGWSNEWSGVTLGGAETDKTETKASPTPTPTPASTPSEETLIPDENMVKAQKQTRNYWFIIPLAGVVFLFFLTYLKRRKGS